MTNEGRFWTRIVNALWAVEALLNRIENGVLDGMPDCYMVIRGSMNWVELKCPTEPKRSDTPLFGGSNHKLSVAQRNWLLSHRQAGGRGWVGIETESWCMLIGAQHADEINLLTMQQLLDRAAWKSPRPVREADWDAFVITLTNPRIKP